MHINILNRVLLAAIAARAVVSRAIPTAQRFESVLYWVQTIALMVGSVTDRFCRDKMTTSGI